MSRERPHLDADRLPAGERHALPDPRPTDPEELRREIAIVRESPVVAALLAATDTFLLVLNPERQIVAWNGPPGQLDLMAGLRPGDLLDCVNARAPGGCGTTAQCETCGALGAILGCSRAGRAVAADCLVTTGSGLAREFDVRATPLDLAGTRFTVVSLRDVSAIRRREALEQIFFHDVLNTVSALRGWAAHLARPGADAGRAGERLDALARRLEREIRDHRALILAESGALVPEPARVEVRELLDDVVATFSQHPAARDRVLEASALPGLEVETDRALLARVLVNMVRNALEATAPRGTVRICAEAERPGAGDGPSAALAPAHARSANDLEDPARGGVRLSVHNAGVIPPEVQGRIFQRSFSTKGVGRGFGTYGMKLMGERYLGGRVWFESTPEAGTTFSIRIPARLPARVPRPEPAALSQTG